MYCLDNLTVTIMEVLLNTAEIRGYLRIKRSDLVTSLKFNVMKNESISPFPR